MLLRLRSYKPSWEAGPERIAEWLEIHAAKVTPPNSQRVKGVTLNPVGLGLGVGGLRVTSNLGLTLNLVAARD